MTTVAVVGWTLAAGGLAFLLVRELLLPHGSAFEPFDDEDPVPLGWWAISGETILDMLRRVEAGENPDLVYMEEYANSSHDHPDDD